MTINSAGYCYQIQGNNRTYLNPKCKTYACETPVFKGSEQTDSFKKTTEQKEVKKEASTGKKWGVGIASAVVCGLGQAINGDWGKAAGFFFGTIAAGFGLSLICPPLGLAAGLGLGICSVIDAVKNARP